MLQTWSESQEPGLRRISYERGKPSGPQQPMSPGEGHRRSLDSGIGYIALIDGFLKRAVGETGLANTFVGLSRAAS